MKLVLAIASVLLASTAFSAEQFIKDRDSIERLNVGSQFIVQEKDLYFPYPGVNRSQLGIGKDGCDARVILADGQSPSRDVLVPVGQKLVLSSNSLSVARTYGVILDTTWIHTLLLENQNGNVIELTCYGDEAYSDIYPWMTFGELKTSLARMFKIIPAQPMEL